MSAEIILSILAMIISTLALVQNSRSSKRGLRIEKIEEMLEITHTLNANYQYFEDTHVFKMDLWLDPEKKEEQDKYLKQSQVLKDIADDINVRKILSRLYILNSSYLPKSTLKSKVGELVAIYTCLCESTVVNPTKIVALPYNEFPKKWEIFEFIEEIQSDLIKEMKLGYSKSASESYKYTKEFKQRYNLK